MATNSNIKSALSFGAGNCFGLPARNVGNGALARLKLWFEDAYSGELDGRAATADDFAAWLYRQVKGQVVQYERRIAENAIPDADDFEDV